jgi:uncharacterized protein YuzE
MRLTYDPAKDTLRLIFHSKRIARTEQLEPGVTLDYDGDGHVIGFRMDHARDRLSVEDLTSVTYENLSTHTRSGLKLP